MPTAPRHLSPSIRPAARRLAQRAPATRAPGGVGQERGRICQREQRARLKQRGFGGVVEQVPGTFDADVRRGGDDAIEQALVIEFGGAQHRTTAVGQAEGDDAGVLPR